MLTSSLLSLLAGGAAMYAWSANRRYPTRAASGPALQPPTQWVDSTHEFRVATYNIHRGRGLDGRRDLGRIAEVLRGVDLAGLQEVGCPIVGPQLIREGAPDVQHLARMLDMGWLFLPGQMYWHRPRYGNGLLSRIPLVDWYREPLVDPERDKCRTLTEARATIAGREVVILVTHLSKRAAQTPQLRRVFERFRMHKTAILMGDFNAMPRHPILREMIDSGIATDAIAESLGSDDAPTRIDWVLTRGLDVRGCSVTPAGPSDHPCYQVDLALPALAEVSSASVRRELIHPARDRPAARTPTRDVVHAI